MPNYSSHLESQLFEVKPSGPNQPLKAFLKIYYILQLKKIRASFKCKEIKETNRKNVILKKAICLRRGKIGERKLKKLLKMSCFQLL